MITIQVLTTARTLVSKASSTTVVTVTGAPFTYTGSAQTPATVSVTGAGGLNLTPTADYANNTMRNSHGFLHFWEMITHRF
jgi:hypothetical protein